jgi:hypothetical protein
MNKSESFVSVFQKEVSQNEGDDGCRKTDGNAEELALAVRVNKGSAHHVYLTSGRSPKFRKITQKSPAQSLLHTCIE